MNFKKWLRRLRRQNSSRTKCVYPFSSSDCLGGLKITTETSLEGICPVCGGESIFKDFTDNVRESGPCQSCGASNRQRQMAFCIRQETAHDMSGKFLFDSNYAIYNTETTGALHLELLNSPNYTCSEYLGPEFSGGTVVNNVRHENLQSLSFPDSSFDLVLSSDVLEHMPDPYIACKEIYRVLKTGGLHIFTVPFHAHEEKDEVRAKLIDGSIHYIKDKIYHGDPVRPNEGILVWTIFGLELLVELGGIGFKTKVLKLEETDFGIVGSGAYVFVSKKY